MQQFCDLQGHRQERDISEQLFFPCDAICFWPQMSKEPFILGHFFRQRRPNEDIRANGA